jgi:hypothetical protein
MGCEKESSKPSLMGGAAGLALKISGAEAMAMGPQQEAQALHLLRDVSARFGV